MKRYRTGQRVPFATDTKLPVRKLQMEISSALAANDVLLLVAETGSGKTTQVPQIILESDPSAFVVITQPRRVAAITVANRVAAERGVELGAEVGYAVRFDDRSKRGVTSIRYVTDGVLLREALSEGSSGLKKRYSHVIIDEVHERSVNTDLVLGVIKETLTASPSSKATIPTSGFAARNERFAKMIRSKLPFKVVIMSATTDTQKIMKFFRDKTSLSVGLLKIPGRQFHVKTMYTVKSSSDVLQNVVSAVSLIQNSFTRPGDVLVFMAGQEDIINAIDMTRTALKRERKKKMDARIYPLYAGLSPEDQLRAIEPLSEEERKTTRKVIFSTNIAETSITIPDVVFVIDTGLVKVRALVPHKDVYADVLQIELVSKAQADQRKGRAGRTVDGTVFRLYSEGEFKKFEDYPKPEIVRVDATSTMLQIIALCSSFQKSKPSTKNGQSRGLDTSSSFRNFPLLDPVPQHVLARALETLCVLGATNFQMQLVTRGKLMARFPVPPMLSRSLLESHRVGCVDSMLTLAAVLSVEGSIMLSPPNKRDRAKTAQKRFVSAHGDQLTLVNVLHSFLEVGGASERIRFCRDYFLNYRALVSAESIRFQLHDIMRHGDVISWALQNPLEANIMAAIEDAGIEELVLRCLAAGYFRHAAKQRESDQKYIPIGNRNGGQVWGRGVDIHPGSTLRNKKSNKTPKVVIYDELVITSKPYLRTVSTIEMEWLIQHSDYFAKADS